MNARSGKNRARPMTPARALAPVAAAFVALSLLGACAGGGGVERSLYKAKLSKVRGDKLSFSVVVSPASAGLEGALGAGRDRAIEYCVRHFGNSKIAWETGPETPPDALTIADDKITLMGACAVR